MNKLEQLDIFKESEFLLLMAGAPIWLKVMLSVIIGMEHTLVTQGK